MRTEVTTPPPAMTSTCTFCGEKLTFVRGKGWLHPDGKLIRQKFIFTNRHPQGIWVDDHVATPNCQEGGKMIRAVLPLGYKGVTRLFVHVGNNRFDLIGKIRGEIKKIEPNLSSGYPGYWYISIDTGPLICSLWPNEIQLGNTQT